MTRRVCLVSKFIVLFQRFSSKFKLMTRPNDQLKSSKNWHRWGKYRLIFLGIAVLFLALIAWQLYASLRTAQSSAITNTRNLALLLESRLNTEFQVAERTVASLVEEIPPEAMRSEMAGQYRPQISRWLKSRVQNISSASALRFVDANGNWLYSSVDNDPPMNVADRPYFQQLKSDSASTTIFSDVSVGRVSGRVLMWVAKPVHDREGSFLGAAVTSIDLTSLHEQFHNLELGKDGAVTLRRLDSGALVVRYPGAIEVDNKPAPDLPIRQAILKGGPHGVIKTTSPVDGVQRLYGYRRVGTFPFYSVVGIAENDYLAEWRRDSSFLLIGALLFLATLAVAESRRNGSEIKLRDSEQRFRNLIDRNNAAILQIDPAGGHILDANASACDFYGWSHAQMCGKTLQDINALNPEQVAAECTTAATENRNYLIFAHRLANGETRTVEIHSTPISMGNRSLLILIVYDITERMRDAKQLASLTLDQKAILDSHIVGIFKARDRKFVWTNAAFAEMLGYTKEELIGQSTRVLYPSDQAHADFGDVAYPTIHESEIFRSEIQLQRKNGSLGWYEISGGLLSPGNEESIWGLVDITKRKQMEDQVRQLAFYDTLTELPNRRLLNDRLSQAMVASKRSDHYGALMFLDLDNFKPLNDVHGHLAGDLLLIEVASRLKSCVREMDTLARFGGDEFVVLLSELTRDRVESTTQAEIVAEKIQETLSSPYLLQLTRDGMGVSRTAEHRCTASIGVAMFVGQETTAQEVLKWADLAMYEAKENGRNSIRFYGAGRPKNPAC